MVVVPSAKTAAIKIFAEKGFANTSTSEIAEEAGVAEATIFRHYGTKENLLLSITLPFLKDLIPRMAEELFTELMAQNPGTFEQFIRGLLKNRIEFIKENNLTTAREIQNALKDVFASTLEEMLEAELEDHLGYSRYDYKNKETKNSRNGSCTFIHDFPGKTKAQFNDPIRIEMDTIRGIG